MPMVVVSYQLVLSYLLYSPALWASNSRTCITGVPCICICWMSCSKLECILSSSSSSPSSVGHALSFLLPQFASLSQQNIDFSIHRTAGQDELSHLLSAMAYKFKKLVVLLHEQHKDRLQLSYWTGWQDGFVLTEGVYVAERTKFTLLLQNCVCKKLQVNVINCSQLTPAAWAFIQHTHNPQISTRKVPY